MGKKSIAELKKENLRMQKQHEQEQERKEVEGRHFRLKHRKSIAFMGGVGRAAKGAGKVAKSVGTFAYKKAIAPPKKKKYPKGYKPLGMDDLI